MTWIARYTTFKPSDVMEMTPWQFAIVSETLLEIIEKESGKKS